jgi:hypothetical protein
LAKLIGLVAVAGLAPKILAKPAVAPVLSPANPPVIALRPEIRAVARHPGTV